MLSSIECYEHCQRLISNGIVPGIDKHDKHSLKMRLGNAWNELGRYYKHVSSTMDFSKGRNLENCLPYTQI